MVLTLGGFTPSEARTGGHEARRVEVPVRHNVHGPVHARAQSRPHVRRPARPARAAAHHAGGRHAQGATQRGHASVYAYSLAGRRMADGGRFDPHSDTVASRTLPLGGRARVTNLRNGRSVVVRVRDRGPSTRRRILDVSPGVAARLGMADAGTAPVAVTPLPGLVARAEAAPSGGRGSPRR